MRIVCPNCSSQYEVDASLFPDEGRSVQCAQCDHQWTQYPQEEPPAPVMRLAPSTPQEPPVARQDQGMSPSDRLPPDERAAIRAAVDEEMSLRNERPRGAAPEADQEEDLIRSLREQLSMAEEAEADERRDEDDDDNEDDDPDGNQRSAAPTGRRDLGRAADFAGVSIPSRDPDPAPQRAAFERAVPTSELAAALQEYERDRGPRGGGRAGFVTAIVAFAIATGVYLGAGQISGAVPQAEPYLARYTALVDDARRGVAELAERATALVGQQLAEFQEDAPQGAPAN